MAANTQPIFVLTIPTFNTYRGRLTAANTNRDGSGTIVEFYRAGTYGSRIDKIRIKATVTTTAGMVRIYRGPTTSPTSSNLQLINEVVVSAITVGQSVAGFQADIDESVTGLLLGPNESLYASTHNAEQIDIFVVAGGDF